MRHEFVTGVLLLGATAFAQGPGGVKPAKNEDMQVTAAQMQSILDKVPMKDGKVATVSTRLFTDSSYSCSFIRVAEPDTPHTHGVWSEMYVIQKGSGAIMTGGTMKGPFTSGAVHHLSIVDQNGKSMATADERAAAEAVAAGKVVKQSQNEVPPPNEDAAGTSIEGGRTQKVSPGDIILIPAGVPHTWTKIDQPIVYLDIKFPKPE